MKKILNIDEWKKTRVESFDLNKDLNQIVLDENPGPITGLIYGEGDTITSFIISYMDGGNQYYELMIENGSWTSDDLDELEETLYYDWVLPQSFYSLCGKDQENEIKEIDLILEKMKKQVKFLTNVSDEIEKIHLN